MVVLVIALVATFVLLWLAVPFILLGIKDRLDQILFELRRRP